MDGWMNESDGMTILWIAFMKMLRSVDLRSRKELTAQFQGKQRPDIAVYNYRDGKKLLLNITITHDGLQQTFRVVVRRLGLPPHPKKGKKQQVPAKGLKPWASFQAYRCRGLWTMG